MPWRTERTPYRVWISELMLQQTRVDQVIPYFERFMKRFPTLPDLANAEQDDVLKAWEGLGYYSRARNMHKAAKYIISEHNGKFPSTAETIQALPGVGPYTTAAIGSLAFNLNLAVLDGNVIRVLSRLFAYSESTRTTKGKKELQQLADQLLIKGKAGECNEAFMELGATICLPKNPKCTGCPVSKKCKAFQTDDPLKYPLKAQKKKIPHITVGAAVITNKQGDILIAQRRSEDMLGGLWEFPGGKQEPEESIESCIKRELQEELGIITEIGEFLVLVKHAYSHFTMDMYTHWATIKSGTPKTIECQDFKWIKPSELRKFPYSKADLKIIEKLESLNL